MSADDFWRELMEEIPGGENYGRKRSPFGSWESLSLSEHQASEDEVLPQEPLQGPERRSQRPTDTIVHGTASAYRHSRCRCEACKAWKSVVNARYRKRDMQ